jgi:transcriptional regulator with XRE-family HTH domain
MKISPVLCKAARILLEWSQNDLAVRAGVSIGTISNYEREMVTISDTNLTTITTVFEEEGVQFMHEETAIGVALFK